MTKEKKNSRGIQKEDGQVLPRHPEMAVRETIKTVKALQDVYKRETAALRKADSKGFMALQDEKLTAAHHYQSCMMELLARKEEIRVVSPALKKQLEGAQEKFKTQAEENLVALERMQRCTERLSETLMEAAREAVERQAVKGYGKSGRFEKRGRGSGSMGISETA